MVRIMAYESTYYEFTTTSNEKILVNLTLVACAYPKKKGCVIVMIDGNYFNCLESYDSFMAIFTKKSVDN